MSSKKQLFINTFYSYARQPETGVFFLSAKDYSMQASIGLSAASCAGRGSLLSRGYTTRAEDTLDRGTFSTAAFSENDRNYLYCTKRSRRPSLTDKVLDERVEPVRQVPRIPITAELSRVQLRNSCGGYALARFHSLGARVWPQPQLTLDHFRRDHRSAGPSSPNQKSKQEYFVKGGGGGGVGVSINDERTAWG